MRLAGVSSRMGKLETWWLYLDHGSFSLPGQEQELGDWIPHRANGRRAGEGEYQLVPQSHGGMPSLSSLLHPFCLVLLLLFKTGCHHVVQARLNLAP